MDISETYIKMCEKAIEIQKDHSPQQADCYFIDFTNSIWKNKSEIVYVNEYKWATVPGGAVEWLIPFCWEDGCMKHRIDDGIKPIWLPRQDQLQEIFPGDNNGHKVALCVILIHNWTVRRKRWKKGALPDSMEQLWLAFVMHEKYNKSWNGENWEDE